MILYTYSANGYLRQRKKESYLLKSMVSPGHLAPAWASVSEYFRFSTVASSVYLRVFYKNCVSRFSFEFCDRENVVGGMIAYSQLRSVQETGKLNTWPCQQFSSIN